MNATERVTHTPLPWEVDTDEHGLYRIRAWQDDIHCVVAAVHGDPDYSPECEGNAALIVRSVNAHADLLAALRECHKIGVMLGTGNARERVSASNGGRMIRAVVDAAIAKAKRGE